MRWRRGKWVVGNNSNPHRLPVLCNLQLLICTAQVVLNAPVATLAATQQHPKLALTSCSAANVSLFLAEEKHLVQFSGEKRGRCGRSASHVTSACLFSPFWMVQELNPSLISRVKLRSKPPCGQKKLMTFLLWVQFMCLIFYYHKWKKLRFSVTKGNRNSPFPYQLWSPMYMVEV